MNSPERKGLLISRRGFLKLVGLAAVGAAVYGLWNVRSEDQKNETLKKMNQWEPQVANLLSETVESERLDNLKILSDLARPQFIDLVLHSPNIQTYPLITC